MEPKFSDFTTEFWQKVLRNWVLLFGAENDALYRRAVALYTEADGVYEECFNLSAVPPKLMIYEGDVLPEGVDAVDAEGNFHIPMGGNDEEVKRRIWDAYQKPVQRERDAAERTAEGVRIVVSKQQLMDQDRDDGAGDPNHPKNRSRNMLAILETPQHVRYFANTRGQNLDWWEYKKEAPEAWQIFLNHRFSDEVMETFSGTATIAITNRDGTETVKEDFALWKHWLRSLRVMNGLSTTDMIDPLGIAQQHYSKIENDPRHHFSLERALKIIHKNLFGLPTVTDADGNTQVDFIYAKRFAAMMGQEHCLPDYLKPQLCAAVKGITEAYLRGDLRAEDMPSLNGLMVLLSNDTLSEMLGRKGGKIKSGIAIPYPYLAQTSALYQQGEVDYAIYFAAMPYYSKFSDKNVASPALLPPQAFELAANTATGLGHFLKIYRESTGKSLEEVGDILFVTKEKIKQIEQASCQSEDFVTGVLGETNPCGLPVDEPGKIRADVAEYIRRIHIPPNLEGEGKRRAMAAQANADEGKWLGFGEVASKVFGERPYFAQESIRDGEIIRTPLTPNPEWDSLRAAWEKAIEVRAKPIQPWQEGVLKIGSTEIRYKRGTDGEYRLHADGLSAIRAAILAEKVASSPE